MWLWLMRIATQYQLMRSIGQSRQCGNASGATCWPKLKLMQVATFGGQTCNWFKKPQLLAKSTTFRLNTRDHGIQASGGREVVRIITFRTSGFRNREKFVMHWWYGKIIFFVEPPPKRRFMIIILPSFQLMNAHLMVDIFLSQMFEVFFFYKIQFMIIIILPSLQLMNAHLFN